MVKLVVVCILLAAFQLCGSANGTNNGAGLSQEQGSAGGVMQNEESSADVEAAEQPSSGATELLEGEEVFID